MTSTRSTTNMIGNVVIVPETETEIEIETAGQVAAEVQNREMIGEMMDGIIEGMKEEAIGVTSKGMTEEMTGEVNAGKNDMMIAGMRGGKIGETLGEVEEMRAVTTGVIEEMVEEIETGIETEEGSETGIVATVVRKETTCLSIDMYLGGDADTMRDTAPPNVERHHLPPTMTARPNGNQGRWLSSELSNT